MTAERRGRGRVVLFHVTANADWSNLPLSGLFVEMLRRLVDLSVGIAPAPERDRRWRRRRCWTGSAARAAAAGGRPAARQRDRDDAGLAAAPAGPLRAGRTTASALNLGAALPPLRAAAPIPGARAAADHRHRDGARARAVAAGGGAGADGARHAGGAGPARPAARRRRSACCSPCCSRAGGPGAGGRPGERPALHTRLAYVETGDAQVDQVSRQGLVGLSEFVNQRTAATLAEPAAVTPGADDLSLLSAALLADHAGGAALGGGGRGAQRLHAPRRA